MESLILYWIVVFPLIIMLIIWGLSVYQQGFYNDKNWVPSLFNVWMLRVTIGLIIVCGVIYSLTSSEKISQISLNALFSSAVLLLIWFIFNYLNGIKNKKKI